MSELNHVAQFYRGQLIEAWEAHQAGEFDRSNSICHRWVEQPDTGTFYRAGFHLLLAFSPSDPVAHGRAAVHMYRSLLPNYPELARDKSERALYAYLNIAEEALESAEQRARANFIPYTREHMRQVAREISGDPDAEVTFYGPDDEDVVDPNTGGGDVVMTEDTEQEAAGDAVMEDLQGAFDRSFDVEAAQEDAGYGGVAGEDAADTGVATGEDEYVAASPRLPVRVRRAASGAGLPSPTSSP